MMDAPLRLRSLCRTQEFLEGILGVMPRGTLTAVAQATGVTGVGAEDILMRRGAHIQYMSMICSFERVGSRAYKAGIIIVAVVVVRVEMGADLGGHVLSATIMLLTLNTIPCHRNAIHCCWW